MTNDDTYLFIGDHPETLDSGRRVSRGDELAAGDIDGQVGQRLLAAGQIVQTRPETAKERAARKELANDQSTPPADEAEKTSKETN